HHTAPLFFSLTPRPPRSTLFPYTTLFRSSSTRPAGSTDRPGANASKPPFTPSTNESSRCPRSTPSKRSPRPESCACTRWPSGSRSEEHTSELQSRFDLVCRLLLEKKKKKK